MHIGIFMIFFIVFLIITFLVIFIIKSSKKQKKMLGKFSKKGKSEVDGEVYSYRYFPGSKNSPPFFEVSLELQHKGKFRIKKESAFDRFGKKIGLTKEIETGDLEFDSRFYFVSDFPEMLKNLFSFSMNREIIKYLFSQKFNKIEFNGKILKARIIPYRIKEKLDENMVIEVVKKLINLKKEIAGTQVDLSRIKEIKRRKYLFIGFSIATVSIGFLFSIIGLVNFKAMDVGKIFLFSLKFSFPILVLYLYLSYQKLKGSSSSHTNFLLVLIFSFFGFIFSGLGIISTMNGALDDSIELVNETVIVDKYITKNKDSKSYYLILESWRNDKYEKLKINRRFFNSTEKGSLIEIVSHKGYFNFEWIKEYRKARNGSSY